MDKRIINKQVIIENYSTKNSVIYDNNTNKNFLYGNATKKFIKKIKLNNKDIVVADIGCGTGYVFEILTKKYKKETPGQKIKEAPLVVVGDRKYRERVLSYTSDFIDKTKIVDIDKKIVKGILKKKITHKGKSHKFEKKLK